jgi:hypothetical protein
MKSIVTLALVFVAFSAFAQRNKQLVPIYVPGTAYKNTGWFISPGITYMLPVSRNENLTSYFDATDGLDTAYSGGFNRAGKIGLYLEAGRHKFLTERSLINHIDYGIHFKMLRGRENFSGITNTGIGFAPIESASKFSDSYVGAFFNASNILQISNRYWIQNSLGANVDYRIITRHITGAPFGADWQYPSPLLGQLHYKIGFGWKPEPGIYIMPSIETPILNVYPWESGKSTIPYFVGRSRPFIITIKIQWLSKSMGRKCEGQPGHDPEVDKDKPGRHENNDLWGPQNRKMKRKLKK